MSCTAIPEVMVNSFIHNGYPKMKFYVSLSFFDISYQKEYEIITKKLSHIPSDVF